jgi:hypothetical protein
MVGFELCLHCSHVCLCAFVFLCVSQVVVVLGTDLDWAAEGHDATSISFTAAQLALVANVSAAAKKPVVVVILTATPLDLTPLLSNDKVRVEKDSGCAALRVDTLHKSHRRVAFLEFVPTTHALLVATQIGAILHVGQPSVTALSVGDVLFGVVSPAGRTCQTVYPASYADQISIFDFNMRPGPSPFARPDCTDKEPACPRGTNPGRTCVLASWRANGEG